LGQVIQVFDGHEPEPGSSTSDGCGRREAPQDTRHAVHGFECCCSLEQSRQRQRCPQLKLQARALLQLTHALSLQKAQLPLRFAETSKDAQVDSWRDCRVSAAAGCGLYCRSVPLASNRRPSAVGGWRLNVRKTTVTSRPFCGCSTSLSSLADGDLTVQATVTEDITGAIADSINYAVDALRGLVTTINQSAIQLDSATRQTQALSGHLAKASGAQSKQIASATESAGGMAASAEEVSGNAERAADRRTALGGSGA